MQIKIICLLKFYEKNNNCINSIFLNNLNATEIKFEKIVSNLNQPWSLSFIDENNIIFTEKSGNLFSFNIKIKKNLKLNIIF